MNQVVKVVFKIKEIGNNSNNSKIFFIYEINNCIIKRVKEERH